MSSLSTWISIEAERPWPSNILFLLRVFDVCKLWSLRLSCKMEPNFFRQLSTLQSILRGLFPWEWETKQNKKMLNIWIDLEKFKVLLLKNSRELGFLCDCIIGVCSLNVLKNLFIMLLSKTHFIDCNNEAVKVNVMEICLTKS